VKSTVSLAPRSAETAMIRAMSFRAMPPRQKAGSTVSGPMTNWLPQWEPMTLPMTRPSLSATKAVSGSVAQRVAIMSVVAAKLSGSAS
jgi:hypothetical protein